MQTANKSKYKCKFNLDWKKEYTWLQENKEDVHKAICTLCGKKCGFSIGNGGITDVTKHEGSDRHKEAAIAASKTKTMPMMFQSNVQLNFNLVTLY